MSVDEYVIRVIFVQGKMGVLSIRATAGTGRCGVAEPRRPWFGFAERLALFYAATFFLSGIKVTYLPVWLDWRGLTALEIGWITAAPLFLRVALTPVICYAADRYAAHRVVLIVLAWSAVGVLIATHWAYGFWPVLLLTLLLAVSSTTIMPLTETIAMAGVRRDGHDYGRMRLWGSLSFIAAGYAAGWGVDGFGIVATLGMLLVAAVLVSLAAHCMPATETETAVETATMATSATGSAAAPERRVRPSDIAALLKSWPFACFLMAAGAIQAAHALFYTFGVLLWRQQGLSTFTISGLWAIGVIAEIVLFATSGPVVRAIGAGGLLLAGAAAAVLRWTLMAFDPPLAVLVMLQALHGLTFGATHLGAVHFIAATVAPAQAGTAQALHASVTSGIAMGLATLVAGRLYPEFGGRGYLAMAALSVLGLIVALALQRTSKAPTKV